MAGQAAMTGRWAVKREKSVALGRCGSIIS